MSLTLPAIVDAAIAVADRDGIGGLSMRRIADQLGVGAMSLYRHVADKDALLAAMAEEVARRFPYPVGEQREWTWRQRVDRAVEIDWALYQRHPWVVLAYSAPRYSFGVESLQALEWLATGFADLGVDATRATEMALTLWSHVNGVVLATISEQLLQTDAAQRDPVPSGLADVIAGKAVAGTNHLPMLTSLATTSGATRLVDPRALLDAGVEFLCAGFEASARGPASDGCAADD